MSIYVSGEDKVRLLIDYSSREGFLGERWFRLVYSPENDNEGLYNNLKQRLVEKLPEDFSLDTKLANYEKYTPVVYEAIGLVIIDVFKNIDENSVVSPLELFSYLRDLMGEGFVDSLKCFELLISSGVLERVFNIRLLRLASFLKKRSNHKYLQEAHNTIKEMKKLGLKIDSRLPEHWRR